MDLFLKAFRLVWLSVFLGIVTTPMLGCEEEGTFEEAGEELDEAAEEAEEAVDEAEDEL